MRCCEILALVEFFRHVVDAYAEREKHRPCGELFPAIDLSDGDYELGLAIFETYQYRM